MCGSTQKFICSEHICAIVSDIKVSNTSEGEAANENPAEEMTLSEETTALHSCDLLSQNQLTEALDEVLTSEVI